MELEKHRKEVQNIKTDLSSKDELLKQITQIQGNEGDIKREITTLEEKIKKAKEQNKQLKEKGHTLSLMTDIKEPTDEYLKLQVEQFKAKIAQTEDEITRLSKQNEFREGLRPEKLTSKNNSFFQNKSTMSVQKIIKDISEIKSFLNVMNCCLTY